MALALSEIGIVINLAGLADNSDYSEKQSWHEAEIETWVYLLTQSNTVSFDRTRYRADQGLFCQHRCMRFSCLASGLRRGLLPPQAQRELRPPEDA